MAQKINVQGKIVQIKENTYPSGCRLAIVRIQTQLFDGSNQNLSVKFFNNKNKALADIIGKEYQLGDNIKVIAELKSAQYENFSCSLCNIAQLIARDIIKIPVITTKH